MAFKRVILPDNFLKDNELTQSLADIGIRVGQRPKQTSPNIEDVLLSASIESLENYDWRTLSLVVQWFLKHSSLVNVDRLTRALNELQGDKKLIIFWSALAQTTKHDLRFKRIQSMYRGKRVLLGDRSAKLLLARNGENKRFQKTSLIVPNKMLRSRESDVLKLQDLVKVHLGAYYRVMLGPSYRADCFCEFMKNRSITASEAARLSYSSFKTAWDTKNDWDVIKTAS